VSALAAAIVLVPLLRLRRETGSDDRVALEEPLASSEPVGEVIAGEVPRYASAEALEAAIYPEPEPRSA
jgi:hypothetical protein